MLRNAQTDFMGLWTGKMGNILVAAALSFDLICSGVQTIRAFDVDKVEQYEKTYRVDLENMKWCENECKVTHQISKVSEVQITFVKDEKQNGDILADFVNREDGSHHALSTSKSPIIIVKYEGVCRRSEFSGFPQTDTLF